ncbi:hypothetical protein SIM22_04840 [Bacillus cereus group sp. BfR-BA-01363]|nr:hypothetical protein [Bacillus cereus group sp. BfR-BA-01363]MDX5853457.1 hypothetical protein [Bacillus cereus group sp. BfR-BA-01363]
MNFMMNGAIDGELEHMSLADYNHMRCVQDYGLTNEDMDSGDEDY